MGPGLGGTGAALGGLGDCAGETARTLADPASDRWKLKKTIQRKTKIIVNIGRVKRVYGGRLIIGARGTYYYQCGKLPNVGRDLTTPKGLVSSEPGTYAGATVSGWQLLSP